VPPVRDRAAWIGVAVRLAAAAIWLVAGIAKLLDLEQFRRQVEAYDVLPGGLAAPFAYALPFVEAALGLYLAAGLLVRAAAAVSTALLVVFVAALLQAWARGLSLDCGCFGAVARETVGPLAVLRDAALGLPGLVLLLWPARRLSVDALRGLPDRFGQRFATR
jgi:uncharacterized membrane protein YphA (DoxX/SURF4 family)